MKTAQRFDSYLASIGLNVAQTGSSMGMEMLMEIKTIVAEAVVNAMIHGYGGDEDGISIWRSAVMRKS